MAVVATQSGRWLVKLVNASVSPKNITVQLTTTSSFSCMIMTKQESSTCPLSQHHCPTYDTWCFFLHEIRVGIEHLRLPETLPVNLHLILIPAEHTLGRSQSTCVSLKHECSMWTALTTLYFLHDKLKASVPLASSSNKAVCKSGTACDTIRQSNQQQTHTFSRCHSLQSGSHDATQLRSFSQ